MVNQNGPKTFLQRNRKWQSFLQTLLFLAPQAQIFGKVKEKSSLFWVKNHYSKLIKPLDCPPQANFFKIWMNFKCKTFDSLRILTFEISGGEGQTGQW